MWVVFRMEQGSRQSYDFNTLKETVEFINKSLRAGYDISDVYKEKRKAK